MRTTRTALLALALAGLAVLPAAGPAAADGASTADPTRDAVPAADVRQVDVALHQDVAAVTVWTVAQDGAALRDAAVQVALDTTGDGLANYCPTGPRA